MRLVAKESRACVAASSSGRRAAVLVVASVLAVLPGCGSSSGSGSGVTSCSKTTTAGGETNCIFTSSDAPGYFCTAGYVSASCASTGLVGCCVVSFTADGYTSTSGGCSYNALYDPKSACKMGTWETSVP